MLNISENEIMKIVKTSVHIMPVPLLISLFFWSSELRHQFLLISNSGSSD